MTNPIIQSLFVLRNLTCGILKPSMLVILTAKYAPFVRRIELIEFASLGPVIYEIQC